jgi:hypothetical protein
MNGYVNYKMNKRISLIEFIIWNKISIDKTDINELTFKNFHPKKKFNNWF